jgi:hypothetical protein
MMGTLVKMTKTAVTANFTYTGNQMTLLTTSISKLGSNGLQKW